jgi:hypothetical protein
MELVQRPIILETFHPNLGIEQGASGRLVEVPREKADKRPFPSEVLAIPFEHLYAVPPLAWASASFRPTWANSGSV